MTNSTHSIPPVDLVIVIDTSPSMRDEAQALSQAATAAIQAASSSCPSDLRTEWFGIEGTWKNTNFSRRIRDYLIQECNAPETEIRARKRGELKDAGAQEDAARTLEDIANHFNWREDAARAIFYLGDEALEAGGPQTTQEDIEAANRAISQAKAANVTIHTYLGKSKSKHRESIQSEYARVASETGGQAFTDQDTLKGFEDVLEKVICGSCASQPETPSKRPVRQKTLNVGTFNLYNLVLPNVTYYDTNKYSPEVYQRKKTWIARQIEQMDADIIGFQELFHEEALREILAETPDCANANLITANPTGDKPTVALLSKIPVLNHQIFTEFPDKARIDIEGTAIPLHSFSRPLLSVDLALSDTVECTVFVAHLKSKRPIIPEDADRSDPVEKAKGQARALLRRAAEATALRVILMETLQNRKRPVIVIGDLNDSGLAVTSKIISGEPPWEKLRFAQKQEIWDVLLYSVKDIQARQSYGDFYYTHIYNGYYESLDHIMVSEELVAQNPDRIGKVTYVSVYNDHLIDETLSYEDLEKWKSDHGQVVASIRLED
ncbi:MAG: endonuclease/exonuclease/phosphatase family protein [Coleofasciculus sp. C1-SOL-03]|uniref:endonuclease/exonuclease/phosphatase family protein n=1 Tax=Coleofasciculus sp. C1-SOL-03 TaxID=3069522 RepID=UPI0032F3F260